MRNSFPKSSRTGNCSSGENGAKRSLPCNPRPPFGSIRPWTTLVPLTRDIGSRYCEVAEVLCEKLKSLLLSFQRYYVNDAFYKPGGPVFLMIGGEGEATLKWMENGSW